MTPNRRLLDLLFAPPNEEREEKKKTGLDQLFEPGSGTAVEELLPPARGTKRPRKTDPAEWAFPR